MDLGLVTEYMKNEWIGVEITPPPLSQRERGGMNRIGFDCTVARKWGLVCAIPTFPRMTHQVSN